MQERAQCGTPADSKKPASSTLAYVGETRLCVAHASAVTVAQIQLFPPHNPFLCCSLLVTCEDPVSAVPRELSAITRDYSCCCSLHMLFTNSDAISPPRLHGAHKINAWLSSRIWTVSLLHAFPAVLVAPARFHRNSHISMLM